MILNNHNYEGYNEIPVIIKSNGVTEGKRSIQLHIQEAIKLKDVQNQA